MKRSFKPQQQKQEAEAFPVIVPITRNALQTAQNFAKQTPNKQAAEQIYLNTLAVYTVQNYLEMLGIPTDLSESDSWNPIVRLAFDVADLYIPGQGYLECHPVRAGDSMCHIPSEIRSNCIGLVVVEVDEKQQLAFLLGFTPHMTEEIVPLNQLQSISNLLNHLTQASNQVATGEEPQTFDCQTDKARITDRNKIHQFAQAESTDLREWLEEIFQQEWHPPENVLTKKQLVTTSLSTRRTKRNSARSSKTPLKGVKRAKIIKWNRQSSNPPIVLFLDLKPDEEDLEIRIRVFRATSLPSTNARQNPTDLDYLPPNLKLRLLNPEGQALEEVVSRSDFLDDSLQIAKKFPAGEHFCCEISLNGTKAIEHFIT